MQSHIKYNADIFYNTRSRVFFCAIVFVLFILLRNNANCQSRILEVAPENAAQPIFTDVNFKITEVFDLRGETPVLGIIPSIRKDSLTTILLRQPTALVFQNLVQTLIANPDTGTTMDIAIGISKLYVGFIPGEAKPHSKVELCCHFFKKENNRFCEIYVCEKTVAGFYGQPDIMISKQISEAIIQSLYQFRAMGLDGKCTSDFGSIKEATVNYIENHPVETTLMKQLTVDDLRAYDEPPKKPNYFTTVCSFGAAKPLANQIPHFSYSKGLEYDNNIGLYTSAAVRYFPNKTWGVGVELNTFSKSDHGFSTYIDTSGHAIRARYTQHELTASYLLSFGRLFVNKKTKKSVYIGVSAGKLTYIDERSFLGEYILRGHTTCYRFTMQHCRQLSPRFGIGLYLGVGGGLLQTLTSQDPNNFQVINLSKLDAIRAYNMNIGISFLFGSR